MELKQAFFTAIGLATCDGPRPVELFAGSFTEFEQAAGTQFYPVDDIVADRTGTFIWSDTPWMGVGNSSDTDGMNVLKWMGNYITLHEDDNRSMEMALIDTDARQIIYFSIGYPG